MKLNMMLLVFLLLTGFIVADSTPLNESENNLTDHSPVSEVEALKKRVTELEAELAKYKQVKPVIGSVKHSAKKTPPPKEILKGEKFSLQTTTPKKVSAYLTAAYQTADDLKVKLVQNGFDVLATDEILKGKTVITISNEALRDTNSFLSALHILVNDDHEIRVQNPSYFGAAFLQDKYTFGDFNETLKSLQVVLGDMYISKEQYKLDDLGDYNFMLGMPHFNDTITVAKGSDIISKLTKEGSEKYISYTLKLPNGSVLVGHKLQDVTYGYLKKIDVAHNAQIFPYQVMIEEERAYMLNPKYYLALSFPLLSMTDFMQIASAPEEIVKDIVEAYK